METTFTRFATLIVTLLGKSHPFGVLLVVLDLLLGQYHTNLGHQARQERQFPLALFYYLNVYMMVIFSSALDLQGGHLVITNLNIL